MMLSEGKQRTWLEAVSSQ